MNLDLEALKRPVGPLPLWGWGVVAGGGIVAISLLRGRGGGTSAAPSVYLPPTDNANSGGGGGGGGTGGPADGVTSGQFDALWQLLIDIGNRLPGGGGGGGGTPAPEPEPPIRPAPPPGGGWGVPRTPPATVPGGVPSAPDGYEPPQSTVPAPSLGVPPGYTVINVPGGASGIPQSVLSGDFNVVKLGKGFGVDALQGWTAWAYTPAGTWQQYNPGEYLPDGSTVGLLKAGVSLPGGLNAR